ncbi:MAG: DNA polymerase III subunit gamma/tau [Zetaproteobacteria bacterium]|nr:MAG: DNA polymerase III subunit gamma/tau [Zetaproteobacteria bacterium]
MSYVVLARRWRPRRFADLVGQQVVARTLKNAIADARRAHAYLLTGIRGVGKTTIARIMAMAVNCTRPQQGEPCGECSHCRAITDGSALDVVEMDAASHTGVDDIRDLIAAVRYPPTSMAAKVYIIDEAHMLSNSAFNALLKTLEEPPEHALFILATTEADRLPVTVRSRCQRFDLARLSVEEIRAHLRRVLEAEGVEEVEEGALTLLARAADGSLRDALSLTERVVALERRRIGRDVVIQALGLIGDDSARRLADPVLAGDAEQAVATLRTLVRQGGTARKLLEALTALFHRIACLQLSPVLIEEESDPEMVAWLRRQADCWSPMAVDTRYQIALHGLQSLDWIDEQTGVEMVLIRLARLNLLQPPEAPPPAAPPSAPPERREDGEGEGTHDTISPVAERGGGSAPSSSCAPAASPTDIAFPAEGGGWARSWAEAIAAYQQEQPAQAAVLEHVRCRRFDDQGVVLLLNELQERAIGITQRRRFQEWLGRTVEWRRDDGSGAEIETLSQTRKRQAAEEQTRLRRQAEEDPHIRRLMAELDCTLIDVLPPGAAPAEEQADPAPAEERSPSTR